MEDETEIPKFPKILFNNFLVKLQKKVKTAVTFIKKELSNKRKALIEGKVGKGKNSSEEKNNKKIKSFEDQVTAIQSFTLADIAKFVVLVQKPLNTVLSDPSASVEQKALTRIAYNKFILKDVQEFRETFPNWKQSIPNIIKTLGINYRKQRVRRLKKQNKKDIVFESERKLFILMNEVVDLGVDAKLLEKISNESVLPLNKKKTNSGGKEKLNTEKGIKGSKKVEMKEDEMDVEDEENEEEEELESTLQNDKVKSPVKITSIFEKGIKGSKKVEMKEDEMDVEDEDDEEEEEELESTLQNDKVKSPVKITSIFENIDDNEYGDSEEDEEEEDDSEEQDEDEEEKEKENILKKKHFKKENKSQIIKKTENTNKSITKTKIDNRLNNNKNKNNNNNNKRKIENNTMVKVLASNPLKKAKLANSLLTDNKIEELTENSFEPPVASASENEIIKKQNKGTSKVALLNLSKLSKKKERQEEEESELLKGGKRIANSSESEDEDFLKNGRVIEKKKKKSSFFVGRMQSAGSDSESDSENLSAEEGTKARSGLKPILNNKLKRKVADDEDTSNYDSSKFFKRNMYRGDDNNNSSSMRDGRFRSRGGDVGGFRGGRGRSERGFRGGRGRGGFRDTDRKLGERKSFGDKRGSFENRDKQGFKGRGRGRGHLGNNDREERRFSDKGRGRGSRGAFADRGRNPRGGFRNRSQDFSDSSNFLPLGNKENSHSQKESGISLHPSWAAKKSQMEKASKTTFKGTKIVFDD